VGAETLFSFDLQYISFFDHSMTSQYDVETQIITKKIKSNRKRKQEVAPDVDGNVILARYIVQCASRT
jgi:hypothetical protein